MVLNPDQQWRDSFPRFAVSTEPPEFLKGVQMVATVSVMIHITVFPGINAEAKKSMTFMLCTTSPLLAA